MLGIQLAIVSVAEAQKFLLRRASVDSNRQPIQGTVTKSFDINSSINETKLTHRLKAG